MRVSEGGIVQLIRAVGAVTNTVTQTVEDDTEDGIKAYCVRAVQLDRIDSEYGLPNLIGRAPVTCWVRPPFPDRAYPSTQAAIAPALEAFQEFKQDGFRIVDGVLALGEELERLYREQRTYQLTDLRELGAINPEKAAQLQSQIDAMEESIVVSVSKSQLG